MIRNNIPLIAIFFLALVVRILMLIFISDDLAIDWGLIANVNSLMDGHGFADPVQTAAGVIIYEPTVFEMPGHTFFIAGLWSLIGERSLVAIQLAQLVIDSFFVFFIYSIGKRLFSKKIALVSAAFFALYLPEAYLSIFIKRDVWVSWTVILACLFYLRFIQEGKKRFVCATALTISVGVYFNPTLLMMPIMMGIFSLPLLSLKKAFISTVAIMTFAVIMLTPWVVRNYNQFGAFIPTRGGFYQTMWEGFGEFKNPFGAVLNDEYTFQQMKLEGFTGRTTTIEYEEFIKPKVKEVLKEHPGWYIKTVLKRIPMALLVNRVTWGVLQDRHLSYHKHFTEKMDEKTLFNYAKFIIKNNPGFLLTKVFDVVILGLAIIGICLSRRKWRESLFLIGVPFYFIGVYIPMHVEGKYMIPTHWVSLIFMSIALLYFRDKIPAIINRKKGV